MKVARGQRSVSALMDDGSDFSSGNTSTVVFASHTYLGSPFVVGSHHLARNFAQAGHRVFYLSTPVTPAHVFKIGDPDTWARTKTALRGGRRVEMRLEEVVPISLVPGNMAARWVDMGGETNPTLTTMLPSVRTTVESRGFGRPDLLFIDQPYFAGISERIDPGRTVYRPTDVYPATTGISAVAAMEKMVLATADGVVCTSSPVQEHVQRLMDDALPCRVVENGVAYEHFAAARDNPPEEYDTIPSPRAVYVGSLDDRFDHDTLRDVAGAVPDLQLVLVGPKGALTRPLRRRSNVHALGTRSFDDVPSYLQHADVGLIPLSDHPANVGRSPMKLFEYLAAGIPVVARRTEELRRRDLAGVYLYDTPDELCAAVQMVIDEPMDVAELRAVAKPKSWRSIAAEVLDFTLAL